MSLTIMNEGITVRTCNAKDIDALVALGIKTFRDTFDEHNEPDNMIRYINTHFTRKTVQEEMLQPGVMFFLAFDGRKTAGYAKIRSTPPPDELNDSTALEIQRLYAHRDYLGKRVGHMLLHTCLSYMRKRGARTAWLGVWENNSRAIAFYQKNGFEKFGEHVFMLGDDAQTDWLMKKTIVG